MEKTRKIVPFLWFNDDAEDAMHFYLSIFKKSKQISVTRNGDQVMSVTFELDGQRFIALNGGPHFKFTPAISFYVDCNSQAEVDRLWNQLSKGGKKSRCGWLTDRYGISWQIVPRILGELMDDEDDAKGERVWQAMLKMTKIDIKKLKAAHAGRKAR